MHDGNKPEGDSYFNSSYTGPTLYTPEDKYQKLTFDKIAKTASAEHATKSNDGWIAISQHFFVSAFIPRRTAPRDIYTKKRRHQPVTPSAPCSRWAPWRRARPCRTTAACIRARRTNSCWKRSTPGLDLVQRLRLG